MDFDIDTIAQVVAWIFIFGISTWLIYIAIILGGTVALASGVHGLSLERKRLHEMLQKVYNELVADRVVGVNMHPSAFIWDSSADTPSIDLKGLRISMPPQHLAAPDADLFHFLCRAFLVTYLEFQRRIVCPADADPEIVAVQKTINRIVSEAVTHRLTRQVYGDVTENWVEAFTPLSDRIPLKNLLDRMNYATQVFIREGQVYSEAKALIFLWDTGKPLVPPWEG